MKHALSLSLSATAAALLLSPNLAFADIPAGYTGTPYLGTPRALPGRVDFEDHDEGGENVGWRVDDHTGNFGVGGCAGNNYRMDFPHPQICETNSGAEVDTYSEGPLMGTTYPSAAMPSSLYIGYTHDADWVNITVDVKTAGMYTVSSTWASEPGGADGIKMQISFNDVVKADVSLPGTGGYHNWVAFDDFATVELEAGIQVLKFAPKSFHVNYDYLQFSLMLPGGGVDDGSGMMGTAGAGGAGTAGAGNAGMSAGGAMGAAGAGEGGASPVGEAGQAGQQSAVSGAGGVSAGVAGMASSVAGTTAAPTAGASGVSAPPVSNELPSGSGSQPPPGGACAFSAVVGASSNRLPLAAFALVVLGTARLQRRSRIRANRRG